VLILLLIGSVMLAAYSFYRLSHQFGVPAALRFFLWRLLRRIQAGSAVEDASGAGTANAATRLYRDLILRVQLKLHEAADDRRFEVALARDCSPATSNRKSSSAKRSVSARKAKRKSAA